MRSFSSAKYIVQRTRTKFAERLSATLPVSHLPGVGQFAGYGGHFAGYGHGGGRRGAARGPETGGKWAECSHWFRYRY